MRRYLRLWAELLRLTWARERGLTAVVFGLETVSLVANVGIAVTLRLTVNGLVNHHHTMAVVSALAAALACTAVLITNRLHGLVGLFLIVEKVGNVVEARLMTDIATLEGIEHLERPEYLDRITVLRGNARRLVGAMWTAIRSVFTVVQLVVILVLLGVVGPWLLLLLVLAIAPLWMDRIARRVEVRTETETADAFRLQQHLFELVTSPGPAKEIRVARVAEDIARRQSSAWQEATTRRFAARLRGAGLRALGWSVFVAGFAIALGWLIHQAAGGATTAGDVIMVVTLSTAMQQQVQNVVGQFTTAMSSSMIIEPYLWLRAYSDEQRAAAAGSEAPPAILRHGISLRGVSYTYPGATSPALTDIDVTLPPGAIVALVGEHGSGKTTLVKLLCKFYGPDSGTITVDGQDLAALDAEAWRRRMSAAFQDFGRYPQATFAESVGLGDITRMADQEALSAAIRAADAERVVARLPQGARTVLSPKYGGVDLSEGQWQKAALARACMRDQPLLFVLDEPTASLDAPSEHAIFEQYMAQAREQGARAGAITLIVSHRLSTVAGADLVLVLSDGHLVEQGTHAELLRDGGRYSQMYGLQAQAYDQSRTTVG